MKEGGAQAPKYPPNPGPTPPPGTLLRITCYIKTNKIQRLVFVDTRQNK